METKKEISSNTLHTHTHDTFYKIEELENRILNADSYEFIKQIPDKSIDLIVTDPPYDFSTGGKMTGIFKDRGKRHFDAIEGKNLDKNINMNIFEDLIRILKTINIYIWCNKEQIHQYLNFFEDKDCLFEIIIWNKTNPIPLVNNRYLPDKEYCLFFRQKGIGINGSYETKKTVYYEKANVFDKELYKHPTIKPLNIIKNLIINSSNEGDIVLDCFLGSGTTAVACKELNRKYIGIEIDKEYYKIAEDRLNGITADGQIGLF